MGILLSDEEIREGLQIRPKITDMQSLTDNLQYVAKAQLKKVVDYLDYPMWGFDSDGLKMKVTPDVATKIRQALLKEIE